VLDDRFLEWKLSNAEKDVAMFLIKGSSTAEIALMRNTSEGTIKAQNAAIYKKAGVTGKTQLLSLFVEDLFEENN
jgi:DNA-binding NarL/FixJ family response regulator